MYVGDRRGWFQWIMPDSDDDVVDDDEDDDARMGEMRYLI